MMIGDWSKIQQEDMEQETILVTSFFSKLINKFVSKMIAMPPMYAIYVYSIIKSKGHRVNYSRKIRDEVQIQDSDYIVMPTSIIAHETEKKYSIYS